MLRIISHWLIPGFSSKIAVSITKNDNFVFLTIKKSNDFFKLMKSFNWETGRSVPS